MQKTDSLTKLGSQNTKYEYNNPSIDLLETFENTAGQGVVPFVCNEFSSLCPKTGQPDFAHIEIVYIPNKLCIESKSLKLYLFAFRNHGDFHEDVIHQIMQDIKEKIDPYFIRVYGDFNVRGGISIKPVAMEYKKEITKEQERNCDKRMEHYDRLRHFDYIK